MPLPRLHSHIGDEGDIFFFDGEIFLLRHSRVGLLGLLYALTHLLHLLLHGLHLLRRMRLSRVDQAQIGIAIAHRRDVAEERGELKIILLRNGVTFVIMATRTANGHAEHGLGGDTNVVINDIVKMLQAIGRFIIPLHQTMVASGNQGLCSRVRDFIAGELLGKKLIIGFVFVEGIDDVIAVTPNKGFRSVALETLGLSIAHEVEPMTAPFFTILWQCEQSIDALFPSVSRGIIFKGLHFRERWSQPSKVKGGTAQQLTARSRRIRLEPTSLTFHFEKFVNRVSKLCHFRNSRTLHRFV